MRVPKVSAVARLCLISRTGPVVSPDAGGGKGVCLNPSGAGRLLAVNLGAQEIVIPLFVWLSLSPRLLSLGGW